MKHNVLPFIGTQRQKQFIHGKDIDGIFEPIYNTIMAKIRKYQAEAQTGLLIHL